MNEIISNVTATLISFGTSNLMIIMLVVFFVSVILKFLMYFLIKAEYNFSSAFETRTHRFLNREYQEGSHLKKFTEVVQFILEKTFNESYLARKIFRKRKEDSKVAALNRMFLVEVGAKSLIEDTLKQTRYHDSGASPDFKGISKYVFNSNPYFNKLWAFSLKIPVGSPVTGSFWISPPKGSGVSFVMPDLLMT